VHAGAASFWRECYRELRRHAGDERLPNQLRVTLRGLADRTLRRSEAAEQRSIVPRWNRLALRDVTRVPLAGATERQARAAAGELGITPGRPLVTVEIRTREDLFSAALDLIRAEGYQIVRIGDGAIGRISRSDVIDATPRQSAELETFLLGASAFVICATAQLQHAAYRSGTPSLRLDARDPFTAYPIRRDGLFMLSHVVALDTGRPLAIGELLSEHYFRNSRNYGYRPSRAGEITAAVREMLRGIRDGWDETAAQLSFRRAVADAGAALGSRVRHVREWDAAGGFVGDGRLAAVQAEHAL
jgi:hypothetical protein